MYSNEDTETFELNDESKPYNIGHRQIKSKRLIKEADEISKVIATIVLKSR